MDDRPFGGTARGVANPSHFMCSGCYRPMAIGRLATGQVDLCRYCQRGDLHDRRYCRQGHHDAYETDFPLEGRQRAFGCRDCQGINNARPGDRLYGALAPHAPSTEDDDQPDDEDDEDNDGEEIGWMEQGGRWDHEGDEIDQDQDDDAMDRDHDGDHNGEVEEDRGEPGDEDCADDHSDGHDAASHDSDEVSSLSSDSDPSSEDDDDGAGGGKLPFFRCRVCGVPRAKILKVNDRRSPHDLKTCHYCDRRCPEFNTAIANQRKWCIVGAHECPRPDFYANDNEIEGPRCNAHIQPYFECRNCTTARAIYRQGPAGDRFCLYCLAHTPIEHRRQWCIGSGPHPNQGRERPELCFEDFYYCNKCHARARFQHRKKANEGAILQRKQSLRRRFIRSWHGMTSPLALQNEDKTWLGIKVLGSGGYGTAGLWIARDENRGVICDRVAIKVEYERGWKRLTNRRWRDWYEDTRLGSVSPAARPTLKGLTPRVSKEYYLQRLLKGKANIVQVRGFRYDTAHRERHLYLEYCSSGDSFDLLARYGAAYDAARARGDAVTPRMPELALWHLFGCLARAVQQMADPRPSTRFPTHDQIVHQDIKPANLLIEAREASKMWPNFKIGDYGQSVHTFRGDANNPHVFYQSTAGTPGYTAQEFSERVSPQRLSPTNIWQIGATMIALMGLEEPAQLDFNADNHDWIYDQSARFRHIDDYYSKKLIRLVRRCMPDEPSDRIKVQTLINSIDRHFKTPEVKNEMRANRAGRDPNVEIVSGRSTRRTVDVGRMMASDYPDCMLKHLYGDQYPLGLEVSTAYMLRAQEQDIRLRETAENQRFELAQAERRR